MNATAYTAFDLHAARMYVITCQNIETRAIDLDTINEFRRRADEYANRMPYSLHRDIVLEALDGWNDAHDFIDKLDAARREN